MKTVEEITKSERHYIEIHKEIRIALISFAVLVAIMALYFLYG